MTRHPQRKWSVETDDSMLSAADIRHLVLEPAVGDAPAFHAIVTCDDRLHKPDLATMECLMEEARNSHADDFLFLASGPAQPKPRTLLVRISQLEAIELAGTAEAATLFFFYGENHKANFASLHLTQENVAAIKAAMTQEGSKFQPTKKGTQNAASELLINMTYEDTQPNPVRQGFTFSMPSLKSASMS